MEEKDKDRKVLFVEIAKRLLVIAVIIILMIFVLWYFGLVKTSRIIASIVVLILLILYFNVGFYLVDKFNEKINEFLLRGARLDKWPVKVRGRKNFIKRIPLLLRILVPIYKIFNPILYFLEFFILKFYFHMCWINLYFYKYENFRRYYYRSIVYMIINPLIRILIYYFYLKKRFIDQFWMVTVFQRIKGLLIWIILFSFWMTYLMEIFSIYWYLLSLMFIYIIMIIFPWLPDKIKNNIKPLAEFNISDPNLIFTEEGEKQIEKEFAEFKQESYLLNPVLINFQKGIQIQADRTKSTYMGKIIRNLFLIIGEDLNYDFSKCNIKDTLDHNELLRSYINIFIYWHISNEEIMLKEIKNKPSYIFYIMIMYSIENISLFNYEDVFSFDNWNIATKDSKISEEDKINIINYKIKKIELLRYWLFNIWVMEDCLNIKYEEFEFVSSFFCFAMVDMPKLLYFKNRFLELNLKSIDVNIDIKSILVEFSYMAEEYAKIDKKLDKLNQSGYESVVKSEFYNNEKLLGQKKEEFVEEMMKKYRKIREEYENLRENKINGV